MISVEKHCSGQASLTLEPLPMKIFVVLQNVHGICCHRIRWRLMEYNNKCLSWNRTGDNSNCLTRLATYYSAIILWLQECPSSVTTLKEFCISFKKMEGTGKIKDSGKLKYTWWVSERRRILEGTGKMGAPDKDGETERSFRCLEVGLFKVTGLKHVSSSVLILTHHLVIVEYIYGSNKEREVIDHLLILWLLVEDNLVLWLRDSLNT